MRKDEDFPRLTMTLRIGAGLKSHLDWAATMNHRSLNAEIIMRLEDSLARENEGTLKDVPSPYLKDVKKKIEELDVVLKEHEKRFRTAAQHIYRMETRFEEAGIEAPERPNDGLDWIDDAEYWPRERTMK